MLSTRGLFGYGAGGITSLSSGSAGTSLTLSDGTSVTLLGVTALAQNSIVQS